MKHPTRSSPKPSGQTKNSRLLDRHAWVQTMGGVTVLFAVPLLMALAFSPNLREWVREMVHPHASEAKATPDLRKPKRFLLPNSLLNIAEVSRVGQDSMSAKAGPESSSFRAILRLQRTLGAHPGQKTADILRAANQQQSSTSRKACPFESIGGEQSLALGAGEDGKLSFAETLDRCADAVEQLAPKPSAH